jgi:DNA (cytosine-5)-methyltransferase 1
MSDRPLLLDLFCGAGGAAVGYHRAGFDVVGVDIAPQPRYPFRIVHRNALLVLLESVRLRNFAAIHASPPCQAYSTTASLHRNEYPRLISDVRDGLRATGLPYVIENVAGARADLIEPIQLCGSSFGLGVRRHRLFEIHGFDVGLVPPCAHHDQPEPVDVTGTGSSRIGPRLDGKGGNSRKPRNLAHAREAMGIDWMTRVELSEAIPPAYTEHIGAALLKHLRAGALSADADAIDVLDLLDGADS